MPLAVLPGTAVRQYFRVASSLAHPDILRSAVLGFAYRRLDVIPRRQEM